MVVTGRRSGGVNVIRIGRHWQPAASFWISEEENQEKCIWWQQAVIVERLRERGGQPFPCPPPWFQQWDSGFQVKGPASSGTTTFKRGDQRLRL